MQSNDLILKVSSLFGNKIDGDLVLLIEQYIAPALNDTVGHLIDTGDDKAEVFRKALTSQTWSASVFPLPADILLHNQKKTVVMYLVTASVKYPIFQVDDWNKLLLIPASTLTNHYTVLENNTFIIREASGGTSGTNLGINYYRVPVIADITAELEPLFLSFLLPKVALKVDEMNSGKK